MKVNLLFIKNTEKFSLIVGQLIFIMAEDKGKTTYEKEPIHSLE